MKFGQIVKWCIGGVCILFLASLFWSPHCSHDRARRVSCASSLKQIGLGLKMYAGDHGEEFPADLLSIRKYLAGNPRLFVCPVTDSDAGDFEHVDLWTDYRYVHGLTEATEPDRPLAYCRPQNHDGEGGNILFVDGHVEWFNADSDDAGGLSFNDALVHGANGKLNPSVSGSASTENPAKDEER